MPRVLRTSIRPGKLVIHECKDKRGRRRVKASKCNTLCRACDTQIVYVFDNTPKADNKKRRMKRR